MHNIVIIDYSLNNLWSVEKSLQFLGCNYISSDNHDNILNATHLILPGVGSFYQAMKIIKDKKLDLAINEAVLKRKIKILGICLGFQLLCSKGFEDGESEGLGLIKQFDGEFPKKYEKDFLDYISMNREEFDKLCDKFRPNHIWEKKSNRWELINPPWE